ncbi:MAG: alpha-isopropylmalate synthase regulatory domain-containing protein [Oscillospiraceae bacterium]|nr:alpha-isopropylmalate synthase regulatory domain-containing protein [Oscillospiraceae bacterium]
MKCIRLSDVTMKKSRKGGEISLSFREKIELCKLLDKLGVDAVETAPIENRRTDGLLLKSLSSAVSNACLTVPVPIGEEDGVAFTWSCLQEAKHPRLQVSLPVSTVQMEYLYHKKPDDMLALIGKTVAECRALCGDVEFSAEDAGRSEREFLLRAVRCAKENGATLITVCDTAGELLPEDYLRFIAELREELGGDVKLGVSVSNNLYMADACAIYAIKAGADEVKVVSCGEDEISLQKLATMLRVHGDELGVQSGVRVTELRRTVEQIEWLCKTNKSKASPFDNGVREEEDFSLSVHDDAEAVRKAAEKLGYDLSEEDAAKVYEAFTIVADKKEKITAKELDVLIATSALQVPPTYTLESFVINSGNIITATSHIRLVKDGKTVEGICVGDGPIDASFLAMEQITGTHYELDDFQIRAVTEGREAMGESVVRLRSRGKLYSGRGLSTDIVASSIMAYINALNKIVYEEAEQ